MSVGKVVAFVICIFMLVALGVVNYARADTAIYGGAWSKHIGDDYDYNEQHNLAAIEYGPVMGGYFRNSYGDHSGFLARKWTWQRGDWSFGFAAGGVVGYRDCFQAAPDEKQQLCPLAVPMASYTESSLQPTVMLVGNAVALSIRLQLD